MHKYSFYFVCTHSNGTFLDLNYNRQCKALYHFIGVCFFPQVCFQCRAELTDFSFSQPLLYFFIFTFKYYFKLHMESPSYLWKTLENQKLFYSDCIYKMSMEGFYEQVGKLMQTFASLTTGPLANFTPSLKLICYFQF